MCTKIVASKYAHTLQFCKARDLDSRSVVQLHINLGLGHGPIICSGSSSHCCCHDGRLPGMSPVHTIA